jgi:thioredoxin reductase
VPGKEVTMTETSCDVLVVGGSAAGLSAALMLGRSRREVLVVDAGEPRNKPAAHMHGYLSRDGLSPAELLRVGRAEVAGYGVQVRSGRVLAVRRDAELPAGVIGFVAELADGGSVRARRVLVATGLVDELPEDVAGLRERWGRDVVHCPYCHGYEVRDKAIVVLGSGPTAAHQALLVRQLSEAVTLVTHTATLTDEDATRLAARGVGVVSGRARRLVVGADDRLRAVELVDGTSVPAEAVFVAPTFVGCDALLTALGAQVTEQGWVAADPWGATSVPGVYAAGNVINPTGHVIVAAAEGARAGATINGDLVEEETKQAVARS